jgi:hypothetical protein
MYTSSDTLDATNRSIPASLLQPPSMFDMEQYRQELLLKSVAESSTTYGITTHTTAQGEDYIISASSTNKISIFKPRRARPVASICVSQATLTTTSDSNNASNLYHVEIIYPTKSKPLLVVAGDSGLLTYDFNKILKDLRSLQKDDDNDDDDDVNDSAAAIPAIPTIAAQPLHTFTPHPSVTESSIEITSFTHLPASDHIVFTAGDNFGPYIYDLASSRFVANLKQDSNKGYLHSVQHVPNSNTLISGGEAGTVDFWDSHSQQLIEKVDMLSRVEGIPKAANLWTSSVACSGDFAAACGGIEGTNRIKQKGWVSYLHVATRTMTSGSSTAQQNNQIKYTRDNVVAVGNHPFVNYLGRANAKQIIAKVPTNIPCGFAIAMMGEDDNHVLVGGAQPQIDCFEDRNLLYSLNPM